MHDPSIPQAEFIQRIHCINCGSTELTELSHGLFTEHPLKEFINNDPWGENPLPHLEGQSWHFVECQSCHQRFHQSVLSETWNAVRFSKWMTKAAIEMFEHTSQQARKESHFLKMTQHVAHVLKVEKLTRNIRGQEDVRILDFGCGWGEFLSVCHQFGFQCYGIDSSSERLKGAQGGVNILKDIVELRHTIPSNAYFHAITLFEVLEHLDNPREILQALHHLLAPNGLLILETPDCTDISDIRTLDDYRKIHPLDHINAFTPETLQSIAKRAGFKYIKQPTTHVSCDSLRIVKTELKRVLQPFLKLTTRFYFVKE
ncbi:MAG: hypothetical protein RL368_853 [Pseudomonadota bacterium]|jgi:2-polyprenyl-3-methyl-5-hydroxy-6-metoxy-1,4-benzoquinol methylase